MEFSRWITSGDSPFSKRLRSSLRDAALAAARLFRLMLLDGFIGSDERGRRAANRRYDTGMGMFCQPPRNGSSDDRWRHGATRLVGSKVAFSWECDHSPNFHARNIVTDTGWKITMDRGLDFRLSKRPRKHA